VDDAAVVMDEMRVVTIRLGGIEIEKLLRDGLGSIGRGGNRFEQIEGAPVFLVEDGARQIVAALCIALEKPPPSTSSAS
jgi:hypothetical protein